MFHGWRIVGVAALAQAVSVGSTFYAYGVFVKPLVAEFGASRLAVTLGLTLMTIVQGAIAPILGRALDRHSPRAILISGVVLQSAGLLLLSQTSAFWQVGALFVSAIGIGSYLFSPLATTTLVARWFVRRRGQALGVTSLGAAAGGILFPPLVTALIDAFGWRGAAGAMGAGLLLLIVPIALFVVRQPEDVGARTDGDPIDAAIAPASPASIAAAVASPTPASATPSEPIEAIEPITTRALVRDRNFWAITVAIGFAYCPTSVLLAHLVPFATDSGISSARAAFVMSGVSLGSVTGRIAFGWLADRIEKRVVVWIMFAWLGVAWSRLLGQPSFVELLVAAIAVGVAIGGIMPLWGALTGDAYGRSGMGAAMGLSNLLMLPFSVGGAPAAAHLFDRTGSYELAFASFLACFAIGAGAISFLRLPRSEARS